MGRTQVQCEEMKSVEGSDYIYSIAGDEYMGAELKLRYIRAMRTMICWGWIALFQMGPDSGIELSIRPAYCNSCQLDDAFLHTFDPRPTFLPLSVKSGFL